MRAKRATKPPQSIHYLLSADRRLQRISLRRISERLKKAKQPTRPIRLKNSARAKGTRLPWAIRSRAIFLGVIGVVAGAAAITARQPFRAADGASAEAPRRADAPVGNVAVAAGLQAATTLAANPASTGAETLADVAGRSTGAIPAVESAAARALDSPATDVRNLALVTIAGCLELDEDTLWLKDTSGAQAPKARSWRMGFLKKRSASIAIVDAADTVGLPRHIGQRVSLTGTLVNREMRVRSLDSIAATCDR